MSTVRTTSVRFIRSGQNAISVMLSQDNIVHHKSPYLANYQIDINLLDGANKILASDYEVTYANAPDSIQIAGGYVDDYTHGLDVNIASQTEVNGFITLNVSYKGQIYSKTIHITTIVDGLNGDKGERGALLRGPQDWKQLGNGYQFYSGASGELYLDSIYYNGNFYLCKKSHTKNSLNYPGSTTDNNNGYWQLGDKIALVAATVLLAEYAVIKNLGAEGITMKDKEGNVVFKAEGGNVTCKTGTFENVDVSGIVRAKLIYSTIKNLLVTDADHASPYYIDPVNDPCDTIFVTTNGAKWIYLPDANKYNGMEISFFQSVMTTMVYGEVYVAAINNQKIAYNTTTTIINGKIVPQKVSGIGHADTRIKLVSNEYTKLKAISGYWYVISGVVTEE